MKIVNTECTFKEFNVYVNELIYKYFGENKDFECKLMHDKSGKAIEAILLHQIGNDWEYDSYSLIIRYLDESSIRSYNVVFFKKKERTFDYLYEECKKTDYIDYRFIKEDN